MNRTSLIWLLIIAASAWTVAQTIVNSITAQQTIQFTLTPSSLTAQSGTVKLVLTPGGTIDTNAIIAAVLARLTNGTASVQLTGTLTSMQFK